MGWPYFHRPVFVMLVAANVSIGGCSDSLATLDPTIEPEAPAYSGAQSVDSAAWNWDKIGPATGGGGPSCDPMTGSSPTEDAASMDVQAMVPPLYECCLGPTPSPDCCYYYPETCPVYPCSQITVTLGAATVQPGGTTTVRVDVASGNGCSVVLTASEIAYSGGHQHLSRPLGQFGAASGTTNGSGYFQTSYTASPFGGTEQIRARSVSVGVEDTENLNVTFPSLQALPSGSNYQLVGSTGSHPTNHYGTAVANNGLVNIASAYAAQYPGSTLNYNDMSLERGGLFDIGPPYGSHWQTPHVEHRFGRNCDVGTSNVPSNRHEDLEQIFINNGSPNFLDEGNHWHLRF